MEKKKVIESVSTAVDDPAELLGFRAYFGRKVLSLSGDSIGKVVDVLYIEDMMTGVLVRNGFFRIFIGKEYFESNTDAAIMLTEDLVVLNKGKLVFDADGRKIGKVITVNRPDKSNDYKSFTVKKNIFSKAVDIPKSDVSVCKKNIILNKIY